MFYKICIFTFNLKESRLSDCFNSTGTKFHIFEPKNDNDSVPWYTGSTYRFSKVSFLRRLCELVLDTNVSPRISGDKPRWVLNISVAKTCKFLWCIETELSLFSISWNVDTLSWYVILWAFSCIELFIVKTSTVEHPN